MKKRAIKICTIDIGTNSVLYLLSKLDIKGRLKPISFSAITTRLGKSLKNKGILTPQAQFRTINTIIRFLKDAKRKKTGNVILAGTSALREAKNANKFAQMLFKKTGLNVTILSEKEEAKLVLSSVKHFLNIKAHNITIADIGGGSTELIFSSKGISTKILSFPIGSVYLTERFQNNIEEMEKYIKTKIESRSLRRRFKKSIKFIGVGGTVTTLGAILKGLKKYEPNKIHNNTTTYKKLIRTLNKLSNLNLSQRKKLIPFDPKRADIIIAGLVILKVIMKAIDVSKMKICDRGLVYGLALNYSKYTRGTFNLHKIS